MADLIYRQDAIDQLHQSINLLEAEDRLKELPSAEPEHDKMIKEIRKWINSGNRGKADYFIVDKVEEIIRNYE